VGEGDGEGEAAGDPDGDADADVPAGEAGDGVVRAAALLEPQAARVRMAKT